MYRTVQAKTNYGYSFIHVEPRGEIKQIQRKWVKSMSLLRNFFFQVAS